MMKKSHIENQYGRKKR